MTTLTVQSDPHTWTATAPGTFVCRACGRVRLGANLPTARYSGGVGYTAMLSLFPGSCVGGKP